MDVSGMKVGERRLLTHPTVPGATLNVLRVGRYAYRLHIPPDSRVRWASTLADVRKDVAHFEETGALPAPTGTSWA